MKLQLLGCLFSWLLCCQVQGIITAELTVYVDTLQYGPLRSLLHPLPSALSLCRT
jgi:hypothetical protein